MHAQNSYTRLFILISGDLLVILSFVWIGRSSHRLSTTDVVESLTTALPFILGWFIVMPWFGVYRANISHDWKSLLPRLIFGWGIAGVVSLVLRTFLLGRPIIGGIPLTFAIVSIGYISLVALVWRLGYSWWANRQREHTSGAKS